MVLFTNTSMIADGKGQATSTSVTWSRIEAFHQGWLACLKALGIPLEHPALFVDPRKVLNNAWVGSIETEVEKEKEADQAEGNSLDTPPHM